MSSEAPVRCLNLYGILCANCSATFLFFQASYLIRQVTDNQLGFLFGQGFDSRKEHITDGHQLTIQHLASLELAAHQQTNLTKLCKTF